MEYFVNQMNHLLPRYVSPCPDPQAWAIDASRTNYPKEEIWYAYQSTCLLVQFLQRLQVVSQFKLLLEVQWSPREVDASSQCISSIPQDNFSVPGEASKATPLGTLVEPQGFKPNPNYFGEVNLRQAGYSPVSYTHLTLPTKA